MIRSTPKAKITKVMTESQPDMELTDFGWAVVSETMPPRGEFQFWLKTPERHVYSFDGDGWERVKPPERHFLPAKDLPHG